MGSCSTCATVVLALCSCTRASEDGYDNSCPVKIVNGVCGSGDPLIDASVDAALTLAPGLIMVNAIDRANDRNTYEVVTESGERVTKFRVAHVADVDDFVRDFVVGSERIYGWAGTFSPQLYATRLDGTTEHHAGVAEWSTINNLTYGGIATLGNYVFVTDMATGGGEAAGLLRFDTTAFTSERFASALPTPDPHDGAADYIDVVVGLDGDLYALRPGTSPGGYQVDVWDPASLAFKGRVVIGGDHRAIAVDTNGDIFAMTFECVIERFSAAGAALGSLPTVTGRCGDLDINPDGKLLSIADPPLVADQAIILADRTLGSFRTLPFDGGITHDARFVAWSNPR